MLLHKISSFTDRSNAMKELLLSSFASC